jgi:hypothetical protein
MMDGMTPEGEELPSCGMMVDTSGSGYSMDSAVAKNVEVGCGKCAYGFRGTRECATAAKIDGKVYLVVGAELEAGANGLCESVKQGTVEGELMGGKFVATAIQLASAQ